MFSKFISVLLLVAPLASALTLNAISGVVTSGGSITITWTPAADGSDPSFSFELINPSFNSQFGIANNVDPSLGTLTLTLPIVPTGEYTIEAVNVGNINQIYSTTPTFTIGATVTGSVSATTPVSGTTTNTKTPTAANLPVTTSTSVTGVSSSLVGTGTGTGIENTLTTENSPSSTGTENSATGTDTETSSASSSSPSSAAVSSRLALTSAYGYAVLLLSAVGGAVAIAL